jgi:hypothetical protein
MQLITACGRHINNRSPSALKAVYSHAYGDSCCYPAGPQQTEGLFTHAQESETNINIIGGSLSRYAITLSTVQGAVERTVGYCSLTLDLRKSSMPEMPLLAISWIS